MRGPRREKPKCAGLEGEGREGRARGKGKGERGGKGNERLAGGKEEEGGGRRVLAKDGRSAGSCKRGVGRAGGGRRGR